MTGATLGLPEISQADFEAFHEAHFSKTALAHFESHYLRPSHNPNSHDELETAEYAAQEHYPEDEDVMEDDGLGYYSDGTKRTLTDEQIAIFRHSELHALRRARESGDKKPTTDANNETMGQNEAMPTSTLGQVPDEQQSKKKKKKRKRGKNKTDGEQIDLRKRTWDVVEAGLDSLDYGD